MHCPLRGLLARFSSEICLEDSLIPQLLNVVYLGNHHHMNNSKICCQLEQWMRPLGLWLQGHMNAWIAEWCEQKPVSYVSLARKVA